MTTSLAEFDRWLTEPEGERLEFKSAQSRYDFDKLLRYCVALANEGGGKLILGVSDDSPRHVVGTRAFPHPEKIEGDIVHQLRIDIHAEALDHPKGRVLIFHVPSRPLGHPVHLNGAYLMRAGESLVPMSPDRLKAIFAETGPDFSAEICPNATFHDLDPDSIDIFRQQWQRKATTRALPTADARQLLEDAELIVDGQITNAALVLFGTPRALTRHLSQAELIFEVRSSEASGPAAQRVELRRGFFSYVNELWQLINTRNELQHVQQGFFVFDIPTFNEIVVREAILNAVSHRDYRLAGSIFIRQYARRLEVVSPGGFPPGITTANILDRQAPRNRRIAETFSRCGLVERSGQGVNRMFEECIKESKPRPDFAGTDDHQVFLTLRGEIQDPLFVRFLEQIGAERVAAYSTQDFLLLDHIHREEPIPQELRSRISPLVEQGVIERVGKTRGTRYILSRRFYGFLGKQGVYTAKRGLDRTTNKMLLLQHIRDSHKTGCQLQELCQVLPALSSDQVQALLREMKRDGVIHLVGRTRGARWYPGPSHTL